MTGEPHERSTTGADHRRAVDETIEPAAPAGRVFAAEPARVCAADELDTARPRAGDIPPRGTWRRGSIAARLREVGAEARPGEARVGEAVVVDPTDVITRSARGRSGREQRVFRATPGSTRGIRSFVRDALEAARARSEVIADFQLVVSELAANAIEHGTGDDVVIEVDGTRPGWWEVTVSSTSAGGRLRPAKDWTIAGADAGSGRGLGIVRRLMDDVRVERRGDRLSVRCRRRR